MGYNIMSSTGIRKIHHIRPTLTQNFSAGAGGSEVINITSLGIVDYNKCVIHALHEGQTNLGIYYGNPLLESNTSMRVYYNYNATVDISSQAIFQIVEYY